MYALRCSVSYKLCELSSIHSSITQRSKKSWAPAQSFFLCPTLKPLFFNILIINVFCVLASPQTKSCLLLIGRPKSSFPARIKKWLFFGLCASSKAFFVAFGLRSPQQESYVVPLLWSRLLCLLLIFFSNHQNLALGALPTVEIKNKSAEGA